MRLKWIYASGVILAVVFISIAMIPDEGVVSAEPEARFTYSPRYPYVDDEVRFDASSSFGDGLTYSWDFGDGHGARGSKVSHTYMESGSYTVELEVTDAQGNVDTTSIFGVPAQNDGILLAYFSPTGLPVGEDSVGLVLPTGLTPE
ncbi:MAG: PKD domain-containing protein, partial [Thermoplasmatota archaeon]